MTDLRIFHLSLFTTDVLFSVQGGNGKPGGQGSEGEKGEKVLFAP